MSDKTIKWTFDADPAPLDSALESSSHKAEDLNEKLKSISDEHKQSCEKAANDIRTMFKEASEASKKSLDSALESSSHKAEDLNEKLKSISDEHKQSCEKAANDIRTMFKEASEASKKSTEDTGKLNESFGEMEAGVELVKNAVGAASYAISGNMKGAWVKAKSSFMAFKKLVAVNPFMALVGFAVAAGAIIVRTFDEMWEKANTLQKKLVELRDYRTKTGLEIDEAGDPTYDENARGTISKTESVEDLKLMLAGTEEEIIAREETARRILDSYDDKKRQAHLLEAGGNWLERLVKPKEMESEEKAKRLEAQAEYERETLLDPSIENLANAKKRAQAIREKIAAIEKAEKEKNKAEKESADAANKKAEEYYEQDLKEYNNRVFLGGASSERNMLETELSRLTSDRESVKGDDIAAKQKRLDIDKEILSVNERLAAIDKEEKATLRDIKEQVVLIGLEREDWLKKRIGQVRERFKEEEDPVEKARLGLMGKQLTHELKTLMGVDSGASIEKADTRPLSPTGSGVRMNDMSKVSAGGVKMVAQPFNTKNGEKWKQTGIVGSSSLNELMDLGRGQSPLSVDPQAKIAQNTEKTNELLEDIRVNLKGVK